MQEAYRVGLYLQFKGRYIIEWCDYISIDYIIKIQNLIIGKKKCCHKKIIQGRCYSVYTKQNYKK